MTDRKVWLITGSARGFGRLWAEAALARGDAVAATVRDLATLDTLVAQYGDAILPLELDVTNRAAVFDAVQDAHRRFGRLDVVISNAGYGMMGAIEEIDIDQARANFETNVFGTINLLQAVLPLLRAQKSGHILPVSSVAGLVTVPTAGIYEAAKFAVEAIAESLAAEVANFGIKVTIIEPGPYATNFMTSASLTVSQPLPAYDEVRKVLATMVKPEDMGDPKATPDAILKVVDAPNPPLRLMLGALLPMVRDVYAERLKTWEQWDDVARAAKGAPIH